MKFYKSYPRYKIGKSYTGNWSIFEYENQYKSSRRHVGTYKTWNECVKFIFDIYDRHINA